MASGLSSGNGLSDSSVLLRFICLYMKRIVTLHVILSETTDLATVRRFLVANERHLRRLYLDFQLKDSRCCLHPHLRIKPRMILACR